MTAEEKKDYLRSYRRIGHEIASLREEIKALRDSWILRGLPLDGLPKGSGGADLSAYMAKMDELEQKLTGKTRELYARQYEIENSIAVMEDATERAVLRNHYLLGWTWEKVADRMGYSVRQVFNVHNSAISHFLK